MVSDEDTLEREDMYILARMKEFVSNEEVVNFGAAQRLLILIERAVSIEKDDSLLDIHYLFGTFLATWRRCPSEDNYHRASRSSSPYCPKINQKAQTARH